MASGGELKVALDAGADPQEIGFAGPGKRDAELRQAVASRAGERGIDARVHALATISAELGLPARAWRCVNPDFELRARA